MLFEIKRIKKRRLKIYTWRMSEAISFSELQI
jgi:hypothetical protein